MSDLKIVVLGAGIVGLTTAIELKKEFRNVSLDIIAENLYDEITSYVAAGIFSPEGGNPGGTEKRTRKWVTDSYNYWDEIRLTPEGEKAGVRQLSGYVFSKNYPHIIRNKYLEGLVPLYRMATQEELRMYPGDWKYGCYYTTLQTDPTRYLKWAADELSHMDVNIIRNKINSFDQLESKYDVVVNCTGIGAKQLCNDDNLVPLRGQVSVVKAPWVKNFVFGEWDTYIIPSFDTVILGGCRQYESYNSSISQQDAAAMRERCDNLVPSLKTAELVEHRTGLRPYRAPLRLETEYKSIAGRQMKIVHNYGHGGCGITISPGTALNTVQLVREMLNAKQSKL